MIFQNFYKAQPQNMKNFVITLLALFSISSVAFEEFLITDIRIVGLQRVSIGSIFTAIPVSVGDKMDQGKVSEITRALFSTAQFNDIQIAKDGSALIISVLERPSISKIELGKKITNTFVFRYFLEIIYLFFFIKCINIVFSKPIVVKFG